MTHKDAHDSELSFAEVMCAVDLFSEWKHHSISLIIWVYSALLESKWDKTRKLSQKYQVCISTLIEKDENKIEYQIDNKNQLVLTSFIFYVIHFSQQL